MQKYLEVFIGNVKVGEITLLANERSLFVFSDAYLSMKDKPILSQSFFDTTGHIIAETKIVQTKLPPFFSNLLPEGHLREYVAQQGGINKQSEFKLIKLLGRDLPGNVIIKANDNFYVNNIEEAKPMNIENQIYRFSLAGVQLKFSAIIENNGGLTIPVSGLGGDWIVKLPSQKFNAVPENEFSMMQLAKEIGIKVPEISLIDMSKVSGLPKLGILASNKAFAIKRFDREQSKRIHIEDFAQVFGVFPNNKYDKASYDNIANMIQSLTGHDGIVDFIRRLVFNIIIGNGDMHLKNFSFIYLDGKTPQLAPAYDFVSTIVYIPNDKLALNLAGEKDMYKISLASFAKFAKKSGIPKSLVIDTVKETIDSTLTAWNKNKYNYPLPNSIVDGIDHHISKLTLVQK
ncbi:MAG: Serine/threonine-protein kinase toxin HipA [Catillopecten margaritatus gill symbiont]|uniref:Serine/threonine-protein kinase toxin HipA n=1 Tax=Catillopecten margaritatus gill symbiont TaxID=3083288 RepID=A0AAU6PG94_9GAMM